MGAPQQALLGTAPASWGGVPTVWLVAEYLFSTNANDTSGNGYHGSNVWSPSFSGWYLTPSNWNCVSIPAATNVGCGRNSAYSRSFVFRTSASGQNNFFISNEEWPAKPFTGQLYFIPTSGKIVIDFINNYIYYRYTNQTNTGSYNNGVWHNMVFTYNGSGPSTANMKIYVDGTEIATTNTLNSIWAQDWDNSSTYSYVGARWYDTTQFFNWNLKKVRLYNRELTPAECASLASDL